jgi:hypothetical protein
VRDRDNETAAKIPRTATSAQGTQCFSIGLQRSRADRARRLDQEVTGDTGITHAVTTPLDADFLEHRKSTATMHHHANNARTYL